MLKHGGQLIEFAKQYQIPLAQWLDLSTGVSPFTYPCPPVTAAAWNRLPEIDDGLEQAAADYYACADLLAVAGSQAAIMQLPAIVAGQRGKLGVVALPRVGYKEHQQAWQNYCSANGERWQIELYDQIPDAALLAKAAVLLFINPNNPGAEKVSPAQLQQWQMQLQKHQGMLIVDEAFIDCTPEQSLLSRPLAENVIVLRSVGKFFGLAGARVGFVFAQQKLLAALAQKLGPWTISGPSRAITRAALVDLNWQQQMREKLAADSLRLHELLSYYFNCEIKGCELFQTVVLADAAQIHQQLCTHGVLIRLCDQQDALRFGLPGSETQWQKLQAALSAVSGLPLYRCADTPVQQGKVQLILGGARSGKSSYGERLALNSGLLVKYIATATAEDEEMVKRVAQHQQQRPSHWQLIEEPLALAEVIRAHSSADTCLLVDCLTLWLSNCLFAEQPCIWTERKIQLLDALKQAQGTVILISNEVGQGIVPIGEVSRRFVDQAGWLHQAIAKQADQVVLVSAGLPQLLKGSASALD